MPDPDKRRLRDIKRAVKKRGNKARRTDLKRELTAEPDPDAPPPTVVPMAELPRHSSAGLNGIDKDSTRRRDADQGSE